MKTNKINKKSDFKVIDIFTLFSDGVSFEDFLSYLNNHGGIDAVSERGTSAFLECIINYSNVMVDFPFANGYAKRLTELGADINKPDINGHVALHYCITSKNYEMFNYLLSNPNINIQVEPPLLGYALAHDIDYTPNIIKLLDLGLDPFKKGTLFSPYQVLVGIDNGSIKIGNQTKDVKPILNHIRELYGDRTE